MDAATKNYRDFAWKLACAQLDDRQNDCVAPIGLWTLLGAIYAGAEGQAKQELSGLLLPSSKMSDTDLLYNIGALNQTLNKQDAIQQNDTEIKVPTFDYLLPDYQETIQRAYDSTLQIKDGGAASMSLTNTIQFQGEWTQKFAETTCPFFNSVCHQGLKSIDALARDIPFLYRSSYTSYQRTSNAVSVTLPFKSEMDSQEAAIKKASVFSLLEPEKPPVFQMVLTMPIEKTVKEYMRGQKNIPHEICPSVGNSLIDLYIPSFKIENRQKDLIPALRSLGLDNVFDRDHAELSRIAKEAIYICKANQDAQVEVSAAGAAAHALTSFHLMTTGISDDPPPLVIRFDHPFIFSLWLNTPVQLPLFIGTFQGT